MTKQIKIEELMSYMRKGWVACGSNGGWWWYSTKPKLDILYGYWGCNGKYCEKIPDIFKIIPAKDWTKSLIKVGGK